MAINYNNPNWQAFGRTYIAGKKQVDTYNAAVQIQAGGDTTFSPAYNSDTDFKDDIDDAVTKLGQTLSNAEKAAAYNSVQATLQRLHQTSQAGALAKEAGKDIGKAASAVAHAVADAALTPLLPLKGGMKAALKIAKYPDANPPNDTLNLAKEFFKKVILEEQFESLEHLAKGRGMSMHKSPVMRNTPKHGPSGLGGGGGGIPAGLGGGGKTSGGGGGSSGDGTPFGIGQVPGGNQQMNKANIPVDSNIPVSQPPPVPPPGQPGYNPAAYAQYLAAQAMQNAGYGGGGGGDGSGDGSGDDSTGGDVYNVTIMAQDSLSDSDLPDDTDYSDDSDAVQDDTDSDQEFLEKKVKYGLGNGINSGFENIDDEDMEYLANATDKEKNLYRKYKMDRHHLDVLNTHIPLLESVDMASTVAGAAGDAIAGPAGGAAATTVTKIVEAIINWFKNAHDKKQAGASTTPQENAATAQAAADLSKMSDAQKRMAAGEGPFSRWFENDDGTINIKHFFESLLGLAAVLLIIWAIFD